MNVETTSGIRITVEPHYMAHLSNPLVKNFLFTYDVVIENLNKFPVQLKRRHWLVDDELGHKREIEGEGVMGKQPILNPGAQHRYTSAVDIRTVKGTMQGSYLMQRMDEDAEFRVRIPQFHLNVPFNLN